MRDIFDIRRFGKYLLTDVKMGIGSYGITLLSFGVAGLAVNILVLLFQLLGGSEYTAMEPVERMALYFVFGAIALIFIPVRYYGRITDKRRGAEFLLSPASSFEKFLSMILVSVVGIPVVYSVIYLGLDALWSVCDRTCHATTVIQELWKSSVFGNGLISVDDAEFGFFMLDDFANVILTFLLGGLIFKKSKLGKTFLTLMGIGIVIGLVFVPFATSPAFLETFVDGAMNLRLADNISDVVMLAGLLTAIYFRVRRIQL